MKHYKFRILIKNRISPMIYKMTQIKNQRLSQPNLDITNKMKIN